MFVSKREENNFLKNNRDTTIWNKNRAKNNRRKNSIFSPGVTYREPEDSTYWLTFKRGFS